MRKILEIKRTDCDAAAEQYFMQTLDLGQAAPPSGPAPDYAGSRLSKIKKIYEAALNVREKLWPQISIQAIIAAYPEQNPAAPPPHLNGNQLFLGGRCFRCTAFERMESKQIRGVIAYFLVVSGCFLPGSFCLEQYYADLWGTAYVEAGRKALRNFLHRQASKQGAALSESFGPGFYGMETSAMKELFQLVEPEEIGLRLTQGGMLDPVKSCGELCFLVEPGYVPLAAACAACKGNAGGCRLCQKAITSAATPSPSRR